MVVVLGSQKMSALPVNCLQCGAPLTRALCEYCGTLGVPQPNPEEQKQALEVFHGLLASKDVPGQVALLKNGFLPDDRDALLEAGLRCVPLIGHDSTGDVEEAAVARLRAVIAKLNLRTDDAQARQAAANFTQELDRYRSITIRNLVVGVLLIAVPVCLVLGLVGAGLYWWLGR